MIKTYLGEKINNHKTQGEWKFHSGNTVIDYKIHGERKIQLAMAINFVSSKDFEETRAINAKSDNIEIFMGNETNEIIEEPLESVLQRYQEGLEESMKGTEFIFNGVDLLHYNLSKISFNRVGSYIGLLND